jgi:hypothetical protein
MAANGIPIRLSSTLADRARKAAAIQDRSLTEQVEHWARLGQVVEAAILNSTLYDLKEISRDDRLMPALAAVDTPNAREKAARSIAQKNPVRFGRTVNTPNKIRKIAGKPRSR